MLILWTKSFDLKKIFLIPFIVLAACGAYDSDAPSDAIDYPGYGKKFFYLEAPCDINVAGIGKVDIEEEYVAGVISCENPNAPYEALKAQAVQARTFLYYKKFVEGKDTILNSQADQVFRCNHAPNDPNADHRRAAAETKGQYLSWSNKIIASFYVAGSIPPNPDAGDPFNSCKANGGSDPTNTQKWVTYNKGKTRCDVEMTDLGFTTPDCDAHPYNRGCASQNGHACLATAGVGYAEQFSFYYGDDVKLETADGLCGGVVIPPSEYDAFCDTKSDGTYCFDNASIIVCKENLSDSVEACDNGCSENACQEPVAATFCTGQADGNYCDKNQSISCLDESISDNTACAGLCKNGLCVKAEVVVTDPTFCTSRADNSYCDGQTVVDCLAEQISSTEICPLGCDRGRCKQKIDIIDEVESDLITTSDGISGGCSTHVNNPSFLLFFLVGFVFLRRKNK